jgi:parvulin-like peptidyl-prolyl isomerase
MVRPTRTPSGKKLARKAPSSKPEDTKQKPRRTGLIIVAVVIAVIAIGIVIGWYVVYVQPLQIPIIVIGDDIINADYFIRRAMLDPSASSDPMVMLQTLTNELLIKQGAPRYGIKVTPEEIDEELRAIARGESETITEEEFKEWYRQQLNETNLSDAEFKEFAHITLLARQLYEYLAARVPSVTEQVHLHMIVLQEYEEALEIKERIESGEDFADVAREVSIHEESGENGGDVGWFPYGALEDSVSWIASNLEIGDVSDPLRTSETSYTIFMVSERAVAREVDEESMAILEARVLDDWITDEHASVKVEFHGRNNGFDSETYAWIQWQISRRTGE